MKAIVEYDGTTYAGFQRQRDLPSLQAAIESAVESATGRPSQIQGAGRTDAGAHARGQVVSFVSETRLDDATLLRAVNAHLPTDVALQSLETVDEGFDPRRQATSREYHYLVISRPTPSPLWADRALHISGNLDLDSMRRAANCLLGVHDFAAFGTASKPGGSTVREIQDIRLEDDGDFIRFIVVGSSFLRHMIRSIVGTLLAVGTGRMEPSRMDAILKSCERRQSAPPVPAHGLYLVDVSYGQRAGNRGYDA